MTFVNPLRKRFEDGRSCIGAWLVTSSTQAAEAMASCGFHWLCVDLEHGTADVSDIEAIFIAAERRGASPVVRIVDLNPSLSCRLLDCGAQGLIVAKVEDAGAFQAFARRCIYPPDGSRGVGLGRANRWGDTFEKYFVEFRPVLVPMIESMKGVEAAAALAALPEVDGLFLGPYDLSTDLGKPGDFSSNEFSVAVATVKDACTRHGKSLGFHQVKPEPEELNARIDEGFTFIAYGTDVVAMRYALNDVADILEEQD